MKLSWQDLEDMVEVFKENFKHIKKINSFTIEESAKETIIEILKKYEKIKMKQKLEKIENEIEKSKYSI